MGEDEAELKGEASSWVKFIKKKKKEREKQQLLTKRATCFHGRQRAPM